MCSYANDGGYVPPICGVWTVGVRPAAGLREAIPLTEASTGLDASGRAPPALLDGGFCASPLGIAALTAHDPLLFDGVYGVSAGGRGGGLGGGECGCNAGPRRCGRSVSLWVPTCLVCLPALRPALLRV